MFAHGETVTLRKYSGKTRNALGQPIASYTDVQLNNVAVFNGTTTEVSDGNGTRVSTGMKLVIDATINVSSQDKVIVREIEYDVDGNSSGPQINPFTGWSGGTKIQLRRVTGG